MLIKAIKSQLNLKPYFYEKSAKVGITGCILGGVIAYLLFVKALPVFGVNLETPLREYSDQVVYSVFGFGILLLICCIYLTCSLCAAVYFFSMVKSGNLDSEEYFNIVFKSQYPTHWQRM